MRDVTGPVSTPFPADYHHSLRPIEDATPQFSADADADAETNQMAFPCSSSSTVRPPRAVRARGQRPRGSRPTLTVVASGGAEARASLVLALASQAFAASQRSAVELVTEATKYAFPSSRFEPRTLEEALMSG